MSKNNGKPKRRKAHLTNVLVESSPDDVMLCQAVEERFIRLCAEYRAMKGMDLIPPPSLNADMMRWRQMAVRHREGDYRRTEAELMSLKTIAQWTVDVNNQLRNQKPEKVHWKGE